MLSRIADLLSGRAEDVLEQQAGGSLPFSNAVLMEALLTCTVSLHSRLDPAFPLMNASCGVIREVLL